jgi:catechol 2,3-dioxygenase-like lactoylglutathione lyase family enzyme
MAKVLGVDHIAIAVRDVDATLEAYTRILGVELITRGRIEMGGMKADAAYLKLGDCVLVLDGAVDPNGFLRKFVDTRGEGLHHLGVVVDDLDGFVADLEAKGVRIPHRESFGDSRREVLLSPKDLAGVVMQVIEWTDKDCPDEASRIERIKRFVHREAG